MEKQGWYNLDNQANIYPAVSNAVNTNVFRISCNLTDMVNPEALLRAVRQTMPSYPYYSMVIRRGLFWFYLEPTDLSPTIEIESHRPMGELFDISIKDLLFKITYYDKRVNLEVFHALSDGGGAMEFLRTIIYHYIIILHSDNFQDSRPVLDKGAVPSVQAEDSFQKYFSAHGEKATSKKANRSFTLGGTIIPDNGVQIITARLSVKSLLALVKSKNATMTAYLTTLMIAAIETEALPKRYLGRDVSVRIPVDLRTMFPSQSFRNFFSTVDIRYNFEGSPKDFSAILESVTAQLQEKVTPENLVKTLNYNMAARENYFARIVPLVIKNKLLQLIYQNNESNCTTILSNLGRVKMPPELSQYIDSIDGFTNPTSAQRIKLTILSYEDVLSLSFTSKIEETKIQRYFIQHLTENGINVSIITNGREKSEIL